MTRVTVRRADAQDLPPVCCVCGQAATRTRPEKFNSYPPWVSWLLLGAGLPWVTSGMIPRSSYAHSEFSVLCIIPWLLALLVARRSATLAIPVCDRHERRSQRAWVTLVVGLILAAATGVAADHVLSDPVLRSQAITGAFGLGGLTVLAALFTRDDRVRAKEI
ncbi:MAG TPA: hypothetical protein VH092_19750, partial [Urbifossiella sp.]|nr:hypothetical protein [Urbifossiella sp.]